MNNNSIQQSSPSSKPVAIWLLIGVGMIVVQVLLGGITRLTESGLSITEWKPITGTLPPMNDVAWQAEFDKYRLTDQFKYVHQNFSLSDFKSIFFWEWFHRVWARLMGVVFFIGFVYFLAKKMFKKEMILPMVILFFLGGIQGAIGWFMVKSGLVPEKYFVGHVELTTHFIAALGLLCYTLWFALSLLVTPQQKLVNPVLKKWLILILVVLVLQLMYGGFMAGLRAAVTAPTWPDINGYLIPKHLNDETPGLKNFVYNPIAIHFIHRGLAYLLFVMIVAWWFKSVNIHGQKLFSRLRGAFLVLVILQVLLGIFTVLNATHTNRLVVLGVAHQFTAMVLVMVIVCLLFVVRRRSSVL
ncbi:COX15/CtaA family protein [Ferruginibacter lapsinanis]|uniref:COX15/CtaA family protein n=1 Tax=Ferruginibacter lapsinanis TaxID=563172 RepID=UPI001E31B51E|nr:COX15/CtaA family protein [Ferruginibacter lapsinanis]UEG50902.1 COX15/CtaA family protein [Ferruginibacter lapsinanis]